MGFSVAGAGDVNGDGFDDLLVGAPLYDAGQIDEGAVFLFVGSATGIGNADPSTATTQLEGNQNHALFGFSVAGGDVNGDGFSDVIVGSHTYTDGEPQEGAVFVFRGSASGIADGNPATAATRLESNSFSSQLYTAPNAAPAIVVGGAELGTSVAAGDVNGDGFADVVAGARFFSNGQRREGGVFVWHGSASGIANGSLATARPSSNRTPTRPRPRRSPRCSARAWRSQTSTGTPSTT